MNLTKLHKQAIVSAVVADIPRAALQTETCGQAAVDADIAAHAPHQIAELWKDPALACYLSITSQTLGRLALSNVYDPYETPLGRIRLLLPEKHELAQSTKEKLDALRDEALAESVAIEAAQSALKSAIYGLRTRKAFVDMFPELEKYAPAEFIAGTNLPAIANVMAGLTTLGWPKQKEPA